MENATKTKRTRTEKLGMCAYDFFRILGNFDENAAKNEEYLGYFRENWADWKTHEVTDAQWDRYQKDIIEDYDFIYDECGGDHDEIKLLFKNQADYERIGSEMDAALASLNEKDQNEKSNKN